MVVYVLSLMQWDFVGRDVKAIVDLDFIGVDYLSRIEEFGG